MMLVHLHLASSPGDPSYPPKWPTPYPHPVARETLAGKMALTLIPPFRGLRNGIEDPNKYLKKLELEGKRSLASFEDDVLRILFTENLADEAENWCLYELSSEIKQDWSQLKHGFLREYKTMTADAPPRKLKLLREIAQLKRRDPENIVGYLKRAARLARMVKIVEAAVGKRGADWRFCAADDHVKAA